LAIIMEKSRCIRHQPRLVQIGRKRRGPFEAGLVHKVDRWRGAATERDRMVELFRGSQGFDQCAADSATGAEDDRDAGLGKRPEVKPRYRFDFG
jgi:hypothetical protein